MAKDRISWVIMLLVFGIPILLILLGLTPVGDWFVNLPG